MITKLIGAATLFTAGALMVGNSTTLGATSLEPFSNEAALSQAGSCSASEAKEEGKAPAKGKEAKAKDGSCGKGSCGSKDKKAKKDGSCGKDKKAKKDGSCGKDKKDAEPK
jgi:uncharacterized low-complexity protein